MVHGANKTKGRKKKFVRTPSGTTTRYEERTSGKPTCVCGRPLPGTTKGNQHTLGKLSKTEKRPSRPYGGVLCSVCTKKLHRDQAKISQE